jgi:spoIIIJ-associated protein
MKSVEATAKTREEAIQTALSELGVEMYEVDKIEILDEGSKGLLGFGARPVKVKVIVEHLSDESKEAPAAPKRPREQRPRPQGDRPERSPRKPRPERGRGKGPEQNRNRPSADKDRDRPKAKAAPQRPRRERPPREARNAAPQAANNNDAPPRPPRKEVDTAPLTDDQGREAATLMGELIAKMGMEATADFVRTEDGAARINVTSEDGAILIGRKGRNLGALQYLINRMTSQGDTSEVTERLVVDVEGYVDRRRESLRELALSMAAKAKESTRNMRLKPLSPQERRIIHVTLEGDEDLRTYSIGDSLYRSVVISPKGAKPERTRGPRGRGRGGRGRGGGGGGGRGGRPEGEASKRDDSDVDAGTFGD